jgi:phospholipase/carboxylesterase
MKVIESTLYHRILPPRKPNASSNPAVILLHGRGADEEDLLGLAPSLDEHLLILSARAPYPFPFGGGYTWYDIGAIGTPDPTMFKSSYDKLSTFIDHCLAEYPIDGKRLYLLGFSMGTIMSYAISLSRPHLFRGVVANSGYILEGTQLSYCWTQLGSTEFFVAHGTQDPVIPVQLARRARELLAANNVLFEYKEYPMAHEISEQSLRDASGWLSNHLDRT